MKQVATSAIFIDKYHPKYVHNEPFKDDEQKMEWIHKHGKCAISLRITFERKKRYYALPYSLTQAEYEIVFFGKSPTSNEKSLKKKIQAFEDKATTIIEGLAFFSWIGFEKQYFTNRAAKDTLLQAYTDAITSFENAGQIGTAVSYQCSINSIEKFEAGLKFANITQSWLSSYETWMLKKGKSLTTISMYLRTLRTLFNARIDDGLLLKELYPFGKRRYEIPTGSNVKKAITLKDIGKIYNYNALPGSMREKAKDLFIYMYLCNGINVKDLCLLRYENIKGDMLQFVRAKTARTKRHTEPIRVVVTEDMKRIMTKWGNANTNKNEYVFPVLQKDLTPERERQLIQQLTHVINSHTKAIATELQIESKLTTYVARHSFSTILKRSGVSTEFISEALGHSNIKTTQNYLGSFEDDSKKEAAKALTAFKM